MLTIFAEVRTLSNNEVITKGDKLTDRNRISQSCINEYDARPLKH